MEKKKIDWGKEALDFIKMLLVSFVIVFLVSQFIVKPIQVQGSSMFPTLEDRQIGLSNILGLSLNGVQRGDIVVIYNPDTKEYLVKRIIGMPNETISCHDDTIYIDGEPLDEPYLDEAYMNRYDVFTEDFPEVTLKSDEVYCLGDNRPRSRDSRFYGAFKLDQLTSKGVFVLFPFSKFGSK